MNRQGILAIALAASALASWISIVGSAANFMSYYPALNQIYADINSISARSYPANVTIDFNFTVSNPTSYVGIKFELLTYNAILPNMTGGRPVYIASGTAVLNGYVQIPPKSALTVQARNILTGFGKTQFQTLCNQSMNSLSWSLSGALAILTPRDGELTDPYGTGANSTC